MSAPTPAEMAAWPAPNYVNPPTMTNATISVTTIATLAMLPCVISRLYFRRRLKGRYGIDDIVIIIAAVSQLHCVKDSQRELTCKSGSASPPPSLPYIQQSGVLDTTSGMSSQNGSLHTKRHSVFLPFQLHPNASIAWRYRRCAVYRLCCAAENLGLLYLP